MAEVDLRPVTPAVVAELLPRLRPIDRLELDCMSAGDPVVALEKIARRARRCRAAYMGGNLVCIFGVSAASLVSDVGCPWALVTREVDQAEVRREFIADSRIALEWIGQDFRRLWNFVADENETAIRWLRWMGFRFPGDEIFLQGHRFLYFEKEVT